MRRIHVRIEDQEGKSVFDQNKIIKATRKSIQININLNLNIPVMEKCHVLWDVNDLFTTIRDTQLPTAGKLLPKRP